MPSVSVLKVLSLILSVIFIYGGWEDLSYHHIHASPIVQISNDYPVIFVGANYAMFIGGIVLGVAMFVAFLYFVLPNSYQSILKLLLSTLTLVAAGSGFFMTPYEMSLLTKNAEGNGYVECPWLTLANGRVSTKAMVKDQRYCYDEKIQKLSEYGDISNLAEIKAHVEATYKPSS